MLYRILRSINSWYALAALWIYLLAFALAAALLFIFPQGTLLLLFVGIASLGLIILVLRLLRAAERRLARQRLDTGVCPVCEQSVTIVLDADHYWQCVNCGAAFAADGREIERPAVFDRANHHST